MSAPKTRVVPLERRFVRASDPGAGELASAFLHWAGKALGWEQVLASRCAVVLGEAGIGKTSEFRAQAAALVASGRTAFSLPLEAVAQRGVAASMDLESGHAYRQWKDRSSAEAWFLLDSLDESKLKGHTFEAILNPFSHELGGEALKRARLILSSRASDWRSSDEAALISFCKYLRSDAQPAPEPLVVQLLPLDERQVASLAMHHGVPDIDRFLNDVRSANAWSFLERPLDVEWLVRYWLSNGRLGSHSELIAFNIDERLAERVDRPTVLPRSDARIAARKLALAATLTRRSSFLLPGETDPKATDAIDPRVFLHGLKNDEIRDLLSRGLFDEATYGRVRIHHRTVQEFLAAEQLKALRLAQCDLDLLLFRTVGTRVVVPAHLAPIAVWLAVDDSRVRRRMIEHAPEHLLDEGDPASLSVEARKKTLRAYARRFADRQHVFHHFDPFGLQRFSGAELAETIRELLSNPSEPEHLRLTLLRMIEVGRMSALAQDALRFAEAPASSIALRTAAIRAVVCAGGDEHRERLAKLVGTPLASNAEVVAELLRGLFPRHLASARAASALVTLVRPAHVFGAIDVLPSELVPACTPSEREEFLTALVDALHAAAADRRGAIRPENYWLSPYLAELAAVILEEGAPHPPALADALELLRVTHGFPEALGSGRLEKLLDERPTLRREAFWRAVSARAASAGRRPRTHWDLMPEQPTNRDADWLRQDCVDRSDVRDRLLAFDCLTHVLPGGLSDPGKLAGLQEVADASGAKHGDDALAKRMRRLQNPRPIDEPPGMRHWVLVQKARDVRSKRQHEQNHAALGNALADIRNGIHFRALLHLYDRCASRGAAARHDALSIDRVRSLYDDEIARAAAEGFRSFWKVAEIERLEDSEPQCTPLACILGLAGITLDVANGLSLTELSDGLLERVTVLATRELNDFPDWFTPVADTRPDIVRAVFRRPLASDFEAPSASGAPNLSLLLWKLPRAPIEVRRASAPVLLDLLTAGEPPSVQALDEVLDVLTSTQTISQTQLADLAAERLAEPFGDDARYAIWWCHWLAVAPQDAIASIVSVTRSGPGAAVVEEISTRLTLVLTRVESHHTSANSPLRRDLEALAALIPIIHSGLRARLAEGRDEADGHGPFAPVRRLRDTLIEWLTEIPGEKTVQMIDRFAEDPQFSAERDWLRHLADARATKDAADAGMRPADALALLQSHIVQPRSTDELFALAAARLEDIREDLAHGDFSVRGVYNPPDEPVLEEHAQNYLAQELENRRRDQYSVVREPEITRRKKPDIRLVHPACDGPVTLEVKIAERWNTRELDYALESQLVGTYMRANNSRFGLLLVCSSGPAMKWEVDDRRVGFDGLIEHLRRRATAIAESQPTVSGLHVVAIDFH